MIIGYISADREIVLPLTIYGDNGQAEPIQLVMDTGFTDALTLPPATIQRLNLPFRETALFSLGDGSDVSFNLYTVTVDWDGQARQIPVLEAEGEPLVGMSLLYGYRLLADIVDGGQVFLSFLP